MTENIIWLLCIGGAGLLFIGIGIFSMVRKTPMHFWSGSKVLPQQLLDVKCYNRENGIMWIVYAIPYFVTAALYFLSPTAATVLLLAACFAGIPLLILNYKRIWNKYCR